jgi:transcriptional regulator CtsR
LTHSLLGLGGVRKKIIKWRNNMNHSTSGAKLSEAIKKAIDDHQITNAEYEDILAIADEDGVINPQERRLLAMLQDMIADKSVKRVP